MSHLMFADFYLQLVHNQLKFLNPVQFQQQISY